MSAPVDLEIRVNTPWGPGGSAFEYTLHSPSGAVDFHHEIIPGPQLNSPDAFHKLIFDQLEKLHDCVDSNGSRLSGDQVLRELTAIGHDFYKMLFPREMRTIYRENQSRIRTLSLTSNEPWIPWELLRPYEHDDDDFLCMRFRMGRWLAGGTSLLSEKKVRRLVAVGSEHSNLDQAGREIQSLRDMFDQVVGLEGSFLPAARSSDLLQIVERGGFDLLHFAGHGEHVDQPREDQIELGQEMFPIRHLSPQAERSLGKTRPLVFFNSCQAGRLTQSLTGLDGWAPRWIERCGCAAYLAPAWSVEDDRASDFAWTFYQELASGATLGEAVFRARHRLRDEDPHQIEWLAYSLYGHANASVSFGDNQLSDYEPPPLRRSQPALSPVHELPPRRKTSRRPSSGPSSIPDPPPRRKTSPQPSGDVKRWASKLPQTLAVGLILGLVGTFAYRIVPWPSDAPTSRTPSGQESPGDPATTEPPPPKAPPPSEDPMELSPPTHNDPIDEAPVDPQPKIGEDVSRSLSPPPPPPPEPAIPMLPTVPGKLGIAVLDRGTRQLDRDLTDAVEAIFLGSVQTVDPFLIQPRSPEIIESLLQGNPPPTAEGRSPWGAEHLLLATASRKSIPQSNPQFTAFTLTLTARLLAMPEGTTRLRTSDTHNGLGASPEAALQQASERCLREVTNYLVGEKNELDTE